MVEDQIIDSRAKLNRLAEEGIKPNSPQPILGRLILYITVVSFLCFLTPVRTQQQVSKPRDFSTPTTSNLQLKQTNQNKLFSSINTNGNVKVSTMTETSVREPQAKIASLDDLSHRLDQTRENVSLERDDTRVPFWNIAHMINSVEQVNLALGNEFAPNESHCPGNFPHIISAGSNGIETDVSFDSNGHPTQAYHGIPCDCGRHCFHQEDLVKFVKYLAQTTNPPASSHLFVVLFDLKLKDLTQAQQKETAGAHLAELLHKHLYAPYQMAATYHSRNSIVQPPLRVVVSINHATDILVVKSFLNYMRNNRLDFMSQQVGFDVGMNDNLTDILAAWDELRGATFNIWQGDGLTNCVNIVRGVDRLKQAIGVRNDQGHFRKVYFWTADIMYHIRSVLRLGIDAILTNKPQRVNQVLNETEFRSKYRLATAYDDPFQQFLIRPSSWKLSPPSVSEIVETIHNIKETSTNFLKTIPDGISAVLSRVNRSMGLSARS